MNHTGCTSNMFQLYNNLKEMHLSLVNEGTKKKVFYYDIRNYLLVANVLFN